MFDYIMPIAIIITRTMKPAFKESDPGTPGKEQK
jgi:hypothetical protein